LILRGLKEKERPQMRVLITGATGFIGRALVERLRQKGHEVTAWVRDEARARSLFNPDIQTITVTSAEDLALALASTDSIINLAGENIFGRRWSKERKKLLVTSRIDTTRRLVEALAPSSRHLAFISASAVGYYGDQKDTLLEESSPPGADFLAELTRAWEQEASRAEPLGVKVVILRIGLVLDGHGGILERLDFLFRTGLGGRLGSGWQYCSWIHLEDLLEVFCLALDCPEMSGAYNATAPQPVQNRELVASLADVLGKPAILPMPGLALRLALGEAATALLGGQRVMPRRLLEMGFAFKHPTLKAALEDLLVAANPRRSPRGASPG
jgi:uncharacterized protein